MCWAQARNWHYITWSSVAIGCILCIRIMHQTCMHRQKWKTVTNLQLFLKQALIDKIPCEDCTVVNIETHPTASHSPVGQYPSENICEVKSCCCSCRPSRRSHDLTVLSSPPVHSFDPSGEMSIQLAPSVWPWNCLQTYIIRLHRMHEMQTILTDGRGVCLSCGFNRQRRVQCTQRTVCAGSFGAAFVKLLWPPVIYYYY